MKTHFHHSLLIFLYNVYILPLRNENYDKLQTILLKPFVYILPLRNENISSSTAHDTINSFISYL